MSLAGPESDAATLSATSSDIGEALCVGSAATLIGLLLLQALGTTR